MKYISTTPKEISSTEYVTLDDYLKDNYSTYKGSCNYNWAYIYQFDDSQDINWLLWQIDSWYNASEVTQEQVSGILLQNYTLWADWLFKHIII